MPRLRATRVPANGNFLIGKNSFSNWKTAASVQAGQKGARVTRADNKFDCVVIGAGIAGASVAAELSATMRVLLLEREGQPGYHSTGRSAALFTEAYGPPVIRALTRASAPFFFAPESPHLDQPLLHLRGVLLAGRADQAEALAGMQEELGAAVVPKTAEEARAMCPLLREDYVAGALFDSRASDIDVHGLHQHYLRSFRANGGELSSNAGVTGLTRSGGDWLVETRGGTVSAPIVVNAAGAWADEVAKLAGVTPAGLTPKRRTALTVLAPEGANPDSWPMTVDVEEQFYLKPETRNLLISPADATPTEPCDAQPEELDIAICIDRIETAFDIQVRRIESKWAGLRSFLPDGGPLAGYDPDAPGFFWLAGQGGYGIQTAPALARTAAALVRDDPIPEDIACQGVTAQALGRARKGFAA